MVTGILPVVGLTLPFMSYGVELTHFICRAGLDSEHPSVAGKDCEGSSEFHSQRDVLEKEMECTRLSLGGGETP